MNEKRIQVYTSCSVNYLPKARVLANTLKQHNPSAKIVLLLNDIVPSWFDQNMEPFDEIWLPSDLGYPRNWIFKHNVMELCTAVKGRALDKLLERNDADLYLYLDPDVCVYEKLDPLYSYLEGAQIGLVPHMLAPEESELGVRLTELSVLMHGTYNLGHLVVRPGDNASRFAKWWANRLDTYCYDDKSFGLFTDQRWMDLVPALFEDVKVLRQPNIDVASWNLATRHVAYADDRKDKYTVNGMPLLTYHFSGTGPSGTHRYIREIFAFDNEAAAEIEKEYESLIGAEQQEELEHWPFGYGVFSNGSGISQKARELYRRDAELQSSFPDPFYVGKKRGSYYQWLRENRVGFVDGVVVPAKLMERAFSQLFDSDFYLERYPHVKELIDADSFESAEEHYVRLGSRLFYDPNVFFVSSYYYEHAHDIGVRSVTRGQPTKERTLLWHYLECGLVNGVEPVEFFDSAWYINRYKDVADAFRTRTICTPLEHWLYFGASENRNPGPDFDSKNYLRHRTAAQLLLEQKSGKRGAFEAFLELEGVVGRTTGY